MITRVEKVLKVLERPRNKYYKFIVHVDDDSKDKMEAVIVDDLKLNVIRCNYNYDTYEIVTYDKSRKYRVINGFYNGTLIAVKA